ncbi:hypothetical protein ABPG74_017280 [Tetrahymena malaccensis]
MWTRLAYLTLSQAFNPVKVGKEWRRPMLSNRYRALLRKQFRLNNIPWIVNLPKDDSNNPRHKQPKGTLEQRNRPFHLAKIKQNVADAPQKELEYRQKAINERPLSGLDAFIQLTVPYWLTARTKEAIREEKSGKSNQQSISLQDKKRGFGAKVKK